MVPVGRFVFCFLEKEGESCLGLISQKKGTGRKSTGLGSACPAGVVAKLSLIEEELEERDFRIRLLMFFVIGQAVRGNFGAGQYFCRFGPLLFGV